MSIEGALTEVTASARSIHETAERHEARIVAAYEAGASIADIAAATVIDGNGVGQFTEEGVRQLLLRHGVKLRPRGRPPAH